MKNKTPTKSTPQSRRYARFRLDLSGPMIFCVVEAVVLLAMTVLILLLGSNTNKKSFTTIFIAFFIFYVFSAGIICLIYAIKAQKTNRARLEAKQIETEIYDMFKYIIDLPYAIVDREGKVKIMNGALQDILGYKNAVSGIDFDALWHFQ